MSELDHWHPVLTTAELGDGPARLTLAGAELVVFRAGGRVAALRDVCPHRRMRLSEGWVEGERLVCPYHGWSFAADGAAACPGTPSVSATAEAFDALERAGAIWVRRAGAASPFPAIDAAGDHPLSVSRHRVRAPLELVVDNFTEVEHTGTTHAFLGYPREAMATITTEVELAEDHVRVFNRGPQKPLPAAIERLFGIYGGDDFVDDWTTYFRPVHSVYHQWWQAPESGEMRPQRLRIAVFYVPIDAGTTDLFTFAFTSAGPWHRLGLNLLLRPLMRTLVELEIRLDKRLLETLADPSPDVRGMRLGRFDRVLREHRRRIDAIYRGRGAPP